MIATTATRPGLRHRAVGREEDLGAARMTRSRIGATSRRNPTGVASSVERPLEPPGGHEGPKPLLARRGITRGMAAAGTRERKPGPLGVASRPARPPPQELGSAIDPSNPLGPPSGGKPRGRAAWTYTTGLTTPTAAARQRGDCAGRVKAGDGWSAGSSALGPTFKPRRGRERTTEARGTTPKEWRLHGAGTVRGNQTPAAAKAEPQTP